MIKICDQCGTEFNTSESKGPTKRCSDECRRTAKRAQRRARLKGAFVEDVDRDAIFQRDGGKCGICGEAILTDVGHLHPLSFHVDHVIPLALGGEHSMANCQAAHRQCNVRKRDQADFKVG